LPASRNARFQFPTDCSDTFARRAASATVTSPAKTDNTILVFSSAGTAGGLAMNDQTPHRSGPQATGPATKSDARHFQVGPPSLNRLGLEQSDRRLTQGVVQCVSDGADGSGDAGLGQFGGQRQRDVLRPGIG